MWQLVLCNAVIMTIPSSPPHPPSYPHPPAAPAGLPPAVGSSASLQELKNIDKCEALSLRRHKSCSERYGQVVMRCGAVLHCQPHKPLPDLHPLKQPCLTRYVSMQGMHEYVRCLTSVEGQAKVVVVGDNGAAQHAETSHQLASALSLSIWDFGDSAAPVLTTLVTNQQVGLPAILHQHNGFLYLC